MGSVTIASTKGQTSKAHVDFKAPFPVRPFVFLSIQNNMSSGYSNIQISASSPSETGFDVTLVNDDASNRNTIVVWMAVEVR